MRIYHEQGRRIIKLSQRSAQNSLWVNDEAGMEKQSLGPWPEGETMSMNIATVFPDFISFLDHDPKSTKSRNHHKIGGDDAEGMVPFAGQIAVPLNIRRAG